MSFFVRNGLYFAWVIALLGFCTSILYGEVFHHSPCFLCWYQRTALFPLALILGIASYRNDRGIIFYALPLALLGGVVALFQGVQIYFSLITNLCHDGEKCSGAFGSTFPLVSVVGFFLIALFLWLSRKS